MRSARLQNLRGLQAAAFATAAGMLASCGGEGAATIQNEPPAQTADPPHTGTATIVWTAPAFNSDGSALTDLAGYRIYYGLSAGKLDASIMLPDPNALTVEIEELVPATWYFAVTAFTSAGVESPPSNVATKTIP